MAKQTRELIASQEALARENIRTMEAGFGKVAQVTQEGFEQLSWEIQDVNRGISELGATFQWGFSEMLNQMTRLNTAVSELVKLTKTPIQTEANEYFQNARDALRRGLYPEALEEVEKAIAKHKLEWRYHSLAGTIRLGNVSGGLEAFDLRKAEEFFLVADSSSSSARRKVKPESIRPLLSLAPAVLLPGPLDGELLKGVRGLGQGVDEIFEFLGGLRSYFGRGALWVSAVAGIGGGDFPLAAFRMRKECLVSGLVQSELGSPNELEAPEIVLRPTRLLLDHALQGLGGEGVTRGVERDGDPAAVGVIVHLVGTRAAVECESVADQCEMILRAVRFRSCE